MISANKINPLVSENFMEVGIVLCSFSSLFLIYEISLKARNRKKLLAHKKQEKASTSMKVETY